MTAADITSIISDSAWTLTAAALTFLAVRGVGRWAWVKLMENAASEYKIKSRW